MFQNITLFSKQNNIISGPGPHWTRKVKIYCTCDLDIGFGSILRWTHKNPIKLTAMISFYKHLSKSPRGIDGTPCSFKFDSSVTVKWGSAPGRGTLIEVFAWDNNFGGREEKLLIAKPILAWAIRDHSDAFFNTVMRTLTMANADEMSIYFAQLIYGEKKFPDAEFEFGQRVSTIIGPNVKTLRTGHVISSIYHEKYKTNMYFLMVDGEIRKKRYFPGDLRPA
ncbi:hypothetical protein SAMN05518672_108152 [Chitinophaga sp. CF118]|uniref:hypothetical protein n=1 Tax=Chitinophaga sp. CF118 TaxID=1884367 RepID=UPI0008E048F4|nr:hypothetical protein [Chitinophaga sp. CF118]SFE62642.1 hypothetical protein SAMN05518672_108152 [Chitinophaga sp. CF118]